MSNEAQPLPTRIPAATGLHFPYRAGDSFAGSTVTAFVSSTEPSVVLADSRTATYYLELAPGGRSGTWHLRS